MCKWNAGLEHRLREFDVIGRTVWCGAQIQEAETSRNVTRWLCELSALCAVSSLGWRSEWADKSCKRKERRRKERVPDFGLRALVRNDSH